MTTPPTLVYADPPYMGQCASYEHYHNDGGDKPWDGYCWDERGTHHALLEWLDQFDGWAYSCNPVDLAWAAQYGRVAEWTKTWHQIRHVATQYAWEPVVFHGARRESRKPMVRDWLACRVAMSTGQRGAKPPEFNDWVLSLMGYELGDNIIDLFPGSGGLGAAVQTRIDVAIAPLL